MAVADVTAREIAPTGGEISGVNIALDGTGDNEPPCTSTATCIARLRRRRAQRRRHGHGKCNDYTMEVVQQIGSDSFDPGHGVLISKTKTGNSSCGTFTCFVWVIDAHPEDINQVDFVARRRHAEMATVGDERQKNDALVQRRPGLGLHVRVRGHANRLHFYIIDKRTDAHGHPALHGRRPLARRRRPADARRRARRAPQLGNAEGYTTCTFHLTNTGAAAAVPAGAHPQDAAAYLDSDVYRLSATATGTGWTRVPQERARHREVRRDGAGPGLHREGAARRPARSR